ncbi:hypothetical protein GCM10028801_05450 [Nocardioides maradonensis]
MTDDAELTPEREAAVRRLLGSVGAAEAPALPGDVADRLDATLADLVAERAGSSPSPEEPLAPVVPLSSRRRRTFAALFVAAAAVVVAGIGVPLLHDDSASTQQTASSDNAVSRAPSNGVAATAPRPDRHTFDKTEAGAVAMGESRFAASGSVTLHRHTLRADLLRLRRRVPPETYRSTTVHAARGFTCAHAAFGRGFLIGSRYAGAPAVVAFRAPAGSTQVAEVLQCGTATVLRSITLPTP